MFLKIKIFDSYCCNKSFQQLTKSSSQIVGQISSTLEPIYLFEKHNKTKFSFTEKNANTLNFLNKKY